MRVFCTAACAALFVLPAVAQKDFYDPDTVRDVYLTFKQSNYWSQLRQNKRSKTNIKADMKVDGKTYKDVGVRFRGQTSYSWLPSNAEKIGFNIDTDAFVSGQSILGYDSMNFNNGFHDPSFMREFITYMVCRKYGPAPKCNFIRLHLNNKYWGIYINVQQPDKDFMQEWFRDPDGNRYRAVPWLGGGGFTASALTWRGASVNNYIGPYEFKKGNGTDLVNLINILNNTPKSSLQAALTKVWSVDTSFWYFACMNAMVQEDSYIGSGKDHFEVVEPFHGQFHIFPFDVNESFDADGRFGTNVSIWLNSTSSRHPAISKTLQFNDWKARYVAHYRTVLDETMSWKTLGPIITKYHKMIAADVAKDTKKLYTTQQFTDNLTKSVRTTVGRLRATVPGLKPFIEARHKYLVGLNEFKTSQPSLSNLRITPTQPKSTDFVTVTVTASNATKVTLWARSKGPFTATAMADDGKSGDGQANDGVWGAKLVPQVPGTQVDYYIGAETGAGVMRFLPRTAEWGSPNYVVAYPTGPSAIKINEILAKNDTVLKDNAGEFDDLLELHNTSNVAVSVNGMYLTDNLTNAKKWKLPNISIPAGGKLIIWCDEDGSQGSTHASFKLSSGGETVALFATDGATMVDKVTFGKQVADVSTGRLFDGSARQVTFMKPTPGASNQITGCGTRTFSALDSTIHRLGLDIVGAPKIGTNVTMTMTGGAANGVANVYLSGGHGSFPLLPSVEILFDPTKILAIIPTKLDAQGKLSASVAIPNIAAAVGMTFVGQAATVDGSGLTASNAVEIIVCK